MFLPSMTKIGAMKSLGVRCVSLTSVLMLLFLRNRRGRFIKSILDVIMTPMKEIY